MGVIQARYNDIVTYNPTTGQDSVQINSTGLTSSGAVSFPLPTDGKYMFIADVVMPTTDDREMHFNVLAGESSMGAWQNGRGDINLYAGESTSDGTYNRVIGPFESARVVRAATSTDNDVDAVGDPVVRLDFKAINSSAAGSTLWASSGAAQTAQANVMLFKLPEVEYTT